MANVTKAMTNTSLDQLIGRSEEHLCACWSGALVHRHMLPALERLRSRARAAGFDLAVASGYRSFDRQRLIWQEKVSGKRPLVDDFGQALTASQLSDDELLSAILRWSALPGISRHHWGTDVDVYDLAAMPAGYQLQLVPEEYQPGGPFAAFHQWLAALVEADDAEGFYLPYQYDHKGVAPEPWHISYAPLAHSFAPSWDRSLYDSLLNQQLWPLNEAIQSRAEEIFQRYVWPTVKGCESANS